MCDKAEKRQQKAGAKIQEEFVEKRYRALNKGLAGPAEAQLKLNIEGCARRHAAAIGSWKDAHKKITHSLQKRDLTINFIARNWFIKPNSYKTYTQTYQRSIDKTISKKPLLKSDALNPAHVRSKADDLVTLPQEWKNAPDKSQRKKLWNAMSFSGATDASAMRNDAEDDIVDGSTFKIAAGNRNVPTLKTTNPNFNPHAKQVFTALNYGQRPHGSSTQYGRSYLILRKELKKQALYFPEDTFYFSTNTNIARLTQQDDASAAAGQVTYDRLGDLMLWAKEGMQDNLWDSCYADQPLENTGAASDLLEAHIFSDIQLGRDVESVVLVREIGTTDEEWETIGWHACLWAGQHSVRVLVKA